MTAEEKLYQRFKRYFVKYDPNIKPYKNRQIIYDLSVLVVYHWGQELPAKVSERQYKKEREKLESLRDEVETGGLYEEDVNRALEAYDLYLSLIRCHRVNQRCRVF